MRRALMAGRFVHCWVTGLKKVGVLLALRKAARGGWQRVARTPIVLRHAHGAAYARLQVHAYRRPYYDAFARAVSGASAAGD
jgi:hypothetical protein